MHQFLYNFPSKNDTEGKCCSTVAIYLHDHLTHTVVSDQLQQVIFHCAVEHARASVACSARVRTAVRRRRPPTQNCPNVILRFAHIIEKVHFERRITETGLVQTKNWGKLLQMIVHFFCNYV